jgi:hypothetical protein
VATKRVKIIVDRGLEADKPLVFELGRLYITTDTHRLFAGQGLTLPMVEIGGAAGSDASFFFTQSTAATVWTVTHGLGKHPAVTVEDSTHREVFAQIDFNSNNQITVTFNAPESGYVSCN